MVVEEHFIFVEVRSARTNGRYKRENVGMSNKKMGEKPIHRKPKVS